MSVLVVVVFHDDDDDLIYLPYFPHVRPCSHHLLTMLGEIARPSM